MKPVAKLGLFVALLSSIGALGAATVQAASTASEGVAVCVSKKTKAVFYRSKCQANESKLKISNTGPNGLSAYEIWLRAGNVGDTNVFLDSLRGADGPMGVTPQVWLPASTCSQKLKSSMASGVSLVFKNERRNFESLTGCTVEKILDVRNEQHKASGFPYVEAISRIGLFEAGPSGGSVFEVRNLQTFKIKYLLRIKNLESASLAYGAPLQPCSSEAEFNNVDTPESVQSTGQEDVFEYTSWIRASSQDNAFFTPINLALCEVDTGWELNQFPMSFQIQEDPRLILDSDASFDPGYAKIWGWN